jgi:phosphoglycolate phosphatase
MLTGARQPNRQMAVQRFSHMIFDLDGTLVDSVRITCAILDAMLADRGSDRRADPALGRAMDAEGGTAMIQAMLGPWCRDVDVDLAEFRQRHAIAATPPDLAFPGVGSALTRLASQGVGLGICSNKPQGLCEKILSDLDLARHFSTIVGARPDLPRKPAPDGARLALLQMRANPAACLYIGDSEVDVRTAAAAGLPVALVSWGYGFAGAHALAPDAMVIDDLAELADQAGF